MTFMNESHLSEAASTSKEQAETSTVEKIKTLTKEGTERSKRILNILRQAFSETREEFQAGRTIISPLAQEVTTETVSTFKVKSQQAADAVNKAWKDESNAPDVTDRIIAFLKIMANTTKERLFPKVEEQVKQQANKLDNVLDDRYGDQYATLKDRFEVVRNWVIVNQPTEAVSTDSQLSDPEPPIVIEVDSEIMQ